MNTKKCAICRTNSPTKKNSHIIPSFLVLEFASSDGSLERDKEILYTIKSSNTTIHIGRNVNEAAIERNFDRLSEEQIEEYKGNNVTEDFVFCNECEKKLGEYLESPYSNLIKNGTEVPGIVPYMFWLSVLWRVDNFNYTNIKLTSHIRASLRNRLKNYFYLRDDNKPTNSVLNQAPFSYKILHYEQRKVGEGCFYGEYDKKSKIASLIVGSFAICFNFSNKQIPSKYSFYNFENAFIQAPNNDGQHTEQIFIIKEEQFNKYKDGLISKIKELKIKNDIEFINKLWVKIKRKGIQLPNTPSDVFIDVVLRERYSNKVKLGEKETIEHFAKSFAKGLECVYNIKIK